MRWTHLAGVCLIAISACPVSALGEDFRIETKVYVDNGEKKKKDNAGPTFENLTLFQRGVVYDFLLTAPCETTIYHPRLGQFTLLDESRKVKTRIDQKLLLEFVAGVKVRAERGNEVVQEAANPKFSATHDQRLSQVQLKGERLEYTAQGQKFSSDDTARQYREFADMYARLNSTRPGSMPPFARLELNQELAKHKLIPTMVELSIRVGGRLTGETIVARTEHAPSWRLLRSDERKIEEAGRQLAEYREVTFDEYFRLSNSPLDAPAQ